MTFGVDYVMIIHIITVLLFYNNNNYSNALLLLFLFSIVIMKTAKILYCDNVFWAEQFASGNEVFPLRSTSQVGNESGQRPSEPLYIVNK